MGRVLVTGANGFVGRTLCPALGDAGFAVRAAVRRGNGSVAGASDDTVAIGSIRPETEWEPALEGVDTIVHLAGRVHVLRKRMRDPQAEVRKVNVLGTERLGWAAVNAGVRRLVYVSSVGVNGRSTPGFAFTEDHEPSPDNLYAASKWEAEQALRRISAETGLEVVILRPTLIYGPGVKANFLRLMKLVDSGLPLPLGAIRNRRSLLYVGNLADLIAKCLRMPEAAGETFLVSDGRDVSTPELIRIIAEAIGKAPRLLPVPAPAMRLIGRATGMSGALEPLLDSLAVDSSKVRRALDWRAPYTIAQGLRETARWFEDEKKREPRYPGG